MACHARECRFDPLSPMYDQLLGAPGVQAKRFSDKIKQMQKSDSLSGNAQRHQHEPRQFGKPKPRKKRDRSCATPRFDELDWFWMPVGQTIIDGIRIISANHASNTTKVGASAGIWSTGWCGTCLFIKPVPTLERKKDVQDASILNGSSL